MAIKKSTVALSKKNPKPTSKAKRPKVAAAKISTTTIHTASGNFGIG